MDENPLMNVLVTGASGLVGSAVCKWLLKNDMSVTATVNNSNFNLDDRNFSVLKIDLVNQQIPENITFSTVVHCSAVIPKPGVSKNDETLFELNRKIDDAVFSYCLNKKSKLVYFSTAFMYTDMLPAVLTEQSSIKSNLAGYYRSKHQSEEFIVSSELLYTIFRLSSPYGDLERQHNVMRLFSEKIKKNLPVTFVGNGDRRQNFLHTDDIAEACRIAIDHSSCELYNLTDDKSYTMLELASSIKEIYGSRSEFNFDHSRSELELNLNFDNSKLKKDLGWAPKCDLKAGLIKTLVH